MDCIMSDTEKGEFYDLTDAELLGMFNLLPEEDIPSFATYDAEYFEEKFPGFPQATYDILVAEVLADDMDKVD